MTEQPKMKDVLCKHCDTEYPASKEFFYTANGKLKVDICKSCKKKMSKENAKNKKPGKPRDKRAYNKAYYLKKKIEKQASISKDI